MVAVSRACGSRARPAAREATAVGWTWLRGEDERRVVARVGVGKSSESAKTRALGHAEADTAVIATVDAGAIASRRAG